MHKRARAVLVSLLLALASLAFAASEDLAKAEQEFRAVTNQQELDVALAIWAPRLEGTVDLAEIEEFADQESVSYVRDKVVIILMSARAAEKSPGTFTQPAEASAQARRILQNPLYADQGVREGRNWLGSSLATALQAVFDFFRRLMGGFRPPEMNRGSNPGVNAEWLTPVMWVVLILALGGLIIWLLTRLNWAKLGKKAKAGGLLDDDEPERTADEWLTRADALEAQGQFREAVRCLYLACLMRFSDAGVARFVRSETNWEHLYRIRSSTKLPPDLNFRTPTSRFDWIWYGNETKGAADVAEFRDTYLDVCRRLGIGGVQ